MVDVSSPGAASSNQAPPPSPQPGIARGAGARMLNETWNEDEAPDKSQNILSICVGQGASDNKVEVCAEVYDDD